MSVGSASMPTSRVDWSSTPPSFTPGASSAPSSSIATVGVDLLVEADLEEVDVHDLVADRVVLLVLDDRPGTDFSPPIFTSNSAEPSTSRWRSSRAPTLRATGSGWLRAVEHAGHEAGAAQAPGLAGSALGALLDCQ